MKKRILILVALSILAAMLLVPGFATGESASVSSVTAQPGQVVELTVSLAGFPAANTLALQFEPEAGLEFVKEQSSWTIDGAIMADIGMEGANTGVWTSSAAEVDVNTQILKLAFQVPTVLADPADLVYTVKCTIMVLKDSQELGKVEATGNITVSVPATDLTLGQESLALDLQTNTTATLSVTVTPANTTETVVWSSSDSSIVSVEGGKLTARKEGTATITAQVGSIQKTCTVTVSCSHTLVQTPAKGATCQEPGNLEYYTCSDCKKVFDKDKVETDLEKQSIPQAPHAGGSPTCASQALCQWCNTPYGDKLPHEFDTAWLTDDDNHWHKCKNCDAISENAPHSYSWVIDQPATDTATGIKHEECVCGLKRSENTEIPKVDHVHSGIEHHEGKRANCYQTGLREYWTCSSEQCTGKMYADAKCQLEITDVTLPMDPNYHAGGTTVRNVVDVNCGKEGYTGDTYCNGCGVPVAEGKTIPPTGNHVAKPKYETDGTHHWKQCVVCDHIITAKEAHTYEWVVDREPTEESEGLQHQQCVCGHTNGEETTVEKLEHTPVLVEEKAATCTEDGSKAHYFCENCSRYYASVNGQVGQEITAQEARIPAMGHEFAEAWLKDIQGHWHVCSCGTASEKETHSQMLVGYVAATEDQPGYSGDKVCSVCGYELEKGQQLPVLQQAAPSDYSWILWAALAVFSIAGLIVVCISMKKQQSEDTES